MEPFGFWENSNGSVLLQKLKPNNLVVLISVRGYVYFNKVLVDSPFLEHLWSRLALKASKCSSRCVPPCAAKVFLFHKATHHYNGGL